MEKLVLWERPLNSFKSIHDTFLASQMPLIGPCGNIFLTLPLSVSWVRGGSEPKGDPGAGLQCRTVLAEVQYGLHMLMLTLQLSLTCRCRPADGRVYRETDTFLAASTYCCQHRAITPGFNAATSIAQNILHQHSLLFKCLGSKINQRNEYIYSTRTH